MKYILGLDIGTTGCKVNVFDENGQVQTSAYREYIDLQHDGLIEPDAVWQEIQSAMQEALESYTEIEAICATSFGETVVAVDKEGNSLADAILYTNANAVEEWKTLDQRVGGQRIAEITGHISHPMYTISRLMWMKEHQPEIYEKTYKFLFFSSFIEMKLGAPASAENTLAARSMAYNVRLGEWSEEILQAAQIDKEKLPEVYKAGEILGYVREDLVKAWGLRKAPAIIAGGHDQPCVALGMGCIHGGDAAYGLGTVECLTLVLDEYMQSEKMTKSHLICGPHVVEGKYVTYGVLFSGGVVLSDIRNKLYAVEKKDAAAGGRNPYEIMMEEIPDDDTGVYYLPHLAGTGTPQMDTSDVGVLYGLNLNTTRGEIVKAAIEGIAMDMRLNIQNMEACHLPVHSIRAAGGGTKTKKAVQIRSDIMEKPILIAEDKQAGARGVFLIAAKTLGWIRDYEEAAQKISGEWIRPQGDPEKIREKADKFWKIYRQTAAL